MRSRQMTLKYLYTYAFILGISVLGLLTPPYFIIGLYGGFFIVLCFSLLAFFFLLKGFMNFREKLLWDWFNLVLLLSISAFVAQIFNVYLVNGIHEINKAYFIQVIRNGFISNLFGLPLLLWIPVLVIIAFRYSPKNIQPKLIIRKTEPIPTKRRVLLSLSLMVIVAFFVVKSREVAKQDKAKGIKDYEHIMERYENETGNSSIEVQKPGLKSILDPEEKTSIKKKIDIDFMVQTIFKDLIEKNYCDINKSAYEIHKDDLNFDGENEVIVFYWGSCFCGTGGCTTQIYKQSNDTLKLIGDFSLTRVPFYLKKEPNTNWKDIVFFLSGGGTKTTQRVYQFRDGKYTLTQESPSSNTLYKEFITRSEGNKNLERIFDDAYKKIYGKAFNE